MKRDFRLTAPSRKRLKTLHIKHLEVSAVGGIGYELLSKLDTELDTDWIRGISHMNGKRLDTCSRSRLTSTKVSASYFAAANWMTP
jgi:hypothetical protein